MLGRAYSELPRETVESGWSEVWSLHFFALCHKMENLRLKKGAACVSKTTQRVEKLPIACFWPSVQLLKRLFRGSKARFGSADGPSVEFFNTLVRYWHTRVVSPAVRVTS